MKLTAGVFCFKPQLGYGVLIYCEYAAVGSQLTTLFDPIYSPTWYFTVPWVKCLRFKVLVEDRFFQLTKSATKFRF